ncbi:MAG: hypothetical protein ACOY3Y_21060 [Acidobacteriota bacterium]
MQPAGTRALLSGLLLLLTVAFYPALFQGRRIAPEASLRVFPPWRGESGPAQSPSPLAVTAARGFGARLQMIAGYGGQTAVWNPWIGGGRVGWLAGPDEGGAPLALLAAGLARRDNVWTGLLALTVGFSFAGAFWLVRRLGGEPRPAVTCGVAYALSGAAATAWLGPDGSSVALGPIAVAIVAGPPTAFVGHLARWAGAAALLAPCGRHAIPFVALALAVEIFRGPGKAVPRRLAAAALALAAAALATAPSRWLAYAGNEDGAHPQPQPYAAAGDTLSALVNPFPEGDPTSGPSSVRNTANSRSGAAFVGAPVVLLALVGTASAAGSGMGVWIAASLASAAAWFGPSALPWLGVHGGHVAPIMALALAVLSASGATALCRRLPERWRSGVGALLALLVMARSAPPALHRMPYAFPADARLTAPLLREEAGTGNRFIALFGTLPPDVSAGLGMPDALAASLRNEPRYAAALGIREDQSIPLSRVAGPELGRAGVRWILEPSPVNVVSGELFSRAEIRSVRLGPETPPRINLHVPAGTGRIGFQLPPEVVPLIVHPGDRATSLVRDRSLDPESDVWRWYTVPPTAGTSLTLLLPGARPPHATVAIDTTGIRVSREGAGVRVWEIRDARPFVSFGGGGAGPATITCAPFRPHALECSVDSAAPGRFVALVKYRPRLWHAVVNGRPAATEPVDGLWIGVDLPAGSQLVSLRATVPTRVTVVGGLGLCFLLVFLWFGRRR